MFNKSNNNNNQNHVAKTVDTFINTPVAPVLQKIGAFRELNRLKNLLNDNQVKIRIYRQSLEDVTFGDLAVLVSEIDSTKSDAVWPALDVYFACFEAENAVVRNNVKSVADFLHTSFDDYFFYAAGFGLPKECVEAFKLYVSKCGVNVNETVVEVYRNIRASAKLNQIKLLVDLLACPLAIILLFPIY